MSQHTKVYVAGAGTISPLGPTSAAMAAAVSAGISAVQETALLSKHLIPIKMAQVPEPVLSPLDPRLISARLPSRQVRLLQMAAPALQQLQPLLPQGVVMPMLLALPDVIADLSHPWRGNAIEQLAMQSGIPLDVRNSKAAEIGRAGGLHALKHVFQLIEQGQDWVLLGGIDTYWDAELLARLDAQDRLLLENSLDGFQPGEGACFVLLASERVAGSLAAPRVALYRPGIAQEAGHRYSDEAYRGDGLANAVREAIAQAPTAKIDAVWTSMIYDSYGAKEFGVAITRNSAHFSPAASQNHPVDRFGDVGAAIGPTLISLIFELSRRPKKPGQHHLLCCSSDTANRTAVRLEIDHKP